METGVWHSDRSVTLTWRQECDTDMETGVWHCDRSVTLTWRQECDSRVPVPAKLSANSRVSTLPGLSVTCLWRPALAWLLRLELLFQEVPGVRRLLVISCLELLQCTVRAAQTGNSRRQNSSFWELTVLTSRRELSSKSSLGKCWKSNFPSQVPGLQQQGLLLPCRQSNNRCQITECSVDNIQSRSLSAWQANDLFGLVSASLGLGTQKQADQFGKAGWQQQQQQACPGHRSRQTGRHTLAHSRQTDMPWPTAGSVSWPQQTGRHALAHSRQAGQLPGHRTYLQQDGQ